MFHVWRVASENVALNVKQNTFISQLSLSQEKYQSFANSPQQQINYGKVTKVERKKNIHFKIQLFETQLFRIWENVTESSSFYSVSDCTTGPGALE